SRRLLADATVQAQSPRRVGMRCGAQRRMKIGGWANWRPKDTRLPWRPQLEREDFRGSLGAARMSACATEIFDRGGKPAFESWLLFKRSRQTSKQPALGKALLTRARKLHSPMRHVDSFPALPHLAAVDSLHE